MSAGRRDGIKHRLARGAGRAAAVVGLAAAAASASAATWSFEADAPLLLGGFVAGQFSGVDGNADTFLDASELTSFAVGYLGAPPTTTSFSIVKTALDAGDAFGFDIVGQAVSFSVADTFGRSIAGGTYEFTSVVGIDFVDGGGMLKVSAVPEPSSWALLLAGLAAVALRVGHRSRASGDEVGRRG